ncbi:dentin sialophosphoprotein-like isoform X2 [Ctenocephalides felis]|nr:dentin sialophosphoprotein-like isoform X2 [Ctenocephalides felis]XP_026476836.1 dentin sialophosphoprotein-like isoform X2 [Ctenocephalides felis]XP_026476837.1 dentin sialophosphoprotein-like isoform X2 [Ctenocephalides felis]
MKTYLKSSASKVSKLSLDDVNDSESSDDNLPESILADHTELSSDNSDLDVNTNNECSGLLDDASVKSEPLSEEENNLSDSHNLSYSTKYSKRKSTEEMKTKTKIKPCTVEEYNEFLVLEKKRNDSSLNMSLNNHDEVNNSVEKVKKKKKKKKSEDTLVESSFNAGSQINFEESLTKKKKHSKDNLSSSIENDSVESTNEFSKYGAVSENNGKSKSKNHKLKKSRDNADNISDEVSSLSFNEANRSKDKKKSNKNKLKPSIINDDGESSITKLSQDRAKPRTKKTEYYSDDSGDDVIESNSKNESNSIVLNQSSKKNYLNKSKANDDSESDDEILNKKYSFQFNRSYELNMDEEPAISQTLSPKKSLDNKNILKAKPLNKNLHLKKIHSQETDLMPSPIVPKLGLFNNVVNSTALDISNMPDTSFPNISQIQVSDKTFKGKVVDLTDKDSTEPESGLIKQYVEQNENIKRKVITNNIKFDGDTSDEEVYIVQCPRNINPALLIDQNIYNSSFQYDGTAYSLSRIPNPVKQVFVFVPGHSSIKSYPLVGNIVIQSEIKAASARDIKKTIPTRVEFPENLKVRHPLFGKKYKKKIFVQPHVMEELVCKKKPKKHKKKVNVDLETDNIESQSTKKRRKSESIEDHIPKKKIKKEKKQESLWNSNDDIERNLFNL